MRHLSLWSGTTKEKSVVHGQTLIGIITDLGQNISGFSRFYRS